MNADACEGGVEGSGGGVGVGHEGGCSRNKKKGFKDCCFSAPVTSATALCVLQVFPPFPCPPSLLRVSLSHRVRCLWHAVVGNVAHKA